MKYSNQVTINLPRDRVAELFDDPENLTKWQDGLLEFETIAGEPGAAGAKSRLVYDTNGRRIEMVETITERRMPDVFAGTYEAKNVKNWVTNRFVPDGPNRTVWTTDNEFKFSGLMALFALFMRRAFPKQTLKDMNRFKAFAEQA